jgi:hypothetical protein
MSTIDARAFASADPERRLGIDKGKADVAQAFIAKQLQIKLTSNVATKEYTFLLSKLRSKSADDVALMPTIYLGLARNSSAICDDTHNRLVRAPPETLACRYFSPQGILLEGVRRCKSCLQASR